MRVSQLSTLAALALALQASAAAAQSFEVINSDDPALKLGSFTSPAGKTVNFTHGIGSGAHRHAKMKGNEFVTVGDRGPNYTCEEAQEMLGVAAEKACAAIGGKGRIYPWPSYTPSIYRIRVEGKSFKVIKQIPLKDASGKLLNGLPNALTVAKSEKAVDGKGAELKADPGAVDLEGIVALKDGTFWLGEENAPSILHVAANGKVLERIVPTGSEKDFAAAGYKVKGGLPAILTRRATNRGIESMAISKDEKFLYFILQNPLANPDAKAYQAARNTRIYKLDRAKMKVVGSYVYELALMAEYKGEENKNANTARISELTYVSGDKLIVDERTDKTTKLFLIDLAGATDIKGTAWEDPATTPSLEQAELAAAKIVPAKKHLLLDSASHPELPKKIESVAFFGDGSLMLLNDNDFGIGGDASTIVRVTGLKLGM